MSVLMTLRATGNPREFELRAEVGVTAPPEIKFWRKLETGDEI